MELRRQLAQVFLETHPSDAVSLLEGMAPEEAAALLADTPAEAVAVCLARAAPHFAVGLLSAVAPGRRGDVVVALELDRAASLLRRMPADARQALLDSLPGPVGRPLRTLLRFRDGTAGAWMDPLSLALPQDLGVSDAVEHIRKHPEQARSNLYVIDREQRLVGALDLRELLLAAPAATLGSVMNPRVHQLRAEADVHTIVAHPGWREVHTLPVVDRGGLYLGMLRYQTLRRLEEELRGEPAEAAGTTAQALGDLFSTAIAGVAEAMSGSGTPVLGPRTGA